MSGSRKSCMGIDQRTNSTGRVLVGRDAGVIECNEPPSAHLPVGGGTHLYLWPMCQRHAIEYATNPDKESK